MRIVGREQADLVARVGDDPAGILVRVGRDAHLPLHELAGLERHLLQPLLVLVEGVVRAIHVAHPARHPRGALLDHAELQAGEAVEHPIDDQRGQRLHRRVADRHVVDRAEVVVAAMEVRHRRQAVVEDTPARAACRRRRHGTRSAGWLPAPSPTTDRSRCGWANDRPGSATGISSALAPACRSPRARPWRCARSRAAARSRSAAGAGRPSRSRPCARVCARATA